MTSKFIEEVRKKEHDLLIKIFIAELWGKKITEDVSKTAELFVNIMENNRDKLLQLLS